MRCEKEKRVIEAATEVFLRYGYKRTTMGDIAQAAGVSRPALYLFYCNKERIFEAAMEGMALSLLEGVRAIAAGPGAPSEKLSQAFECWAIRPFAMMQDSPDARDLVHASPAFAEGLKNRCFAAFEAELVKILEGFPAWPAGTPTLEETAHILSASIHGFKGAARSTTELRGMIGTLLRLTTASLQGHTQ